MTKETFKDRVIAVETEEKDEVSLRLANWTPHGGYTALIDAADKAGLDLTEYSDGDTVAVAEMDYDGNVESFTVPGDEFYADVEVTITGTLRVSVIEGAEELEPTRDDWVEEWKEIVSEDVLGTYLDLNNPDIEIKEVGRLGPGGQEVE